MTSDQTPEYLTVDEAQAYLGIGRAYLYRLAAKHGITRHRPAVGRKVLFLKADLDRLKEPRPVAKSRGD